MSGLIEKVGGKVSVIHLRFVHHGTDDHAQSVAGEQADCTRRWTRWRRAEQEKGQDEKKRWTMSARLPIISDSLPPCPPKQRLRL